MPKSSIYPSNCYITDFGRFGGAEHSLVINLKTAKALEPSLTDRREEQIF
jgi:hypothetical protein